MVTCFVTVETTCGTLTIHGENSTTQSVIGCDDKLPRAEMQAQSWGVEGTTWSQSAAWGRLKEPSLAISLTTASLLSLAIRILLLCRSICRPTACWVTPSRLSTVASSACLVEGRARSGAEMVICFPPQSGGGELVGVIGSSSEM